MCQVTIGPKAYRTIVDTRSWQSYIDEEVAAKIPLSNYVRQACRYSVVLARGIKENAHDAHTAGHQGIRKTIRRITNRYYWPGMFRDISNYVRACQVCQRFKVSQQPPAGLMLTHLPEEQWATVCADFVGPLPRSKHGHTTLLVLQDKFTKWIELVPLRSVTSDGAIKGIRSTIISRFGTPKMLITDHGTQFVSAVFRRALDNWGIKHQLTTPYTPQENAVERANRVVKTMLAQFCEQNQRTWDEPLPEIALALNTSVSESTGFSPAFLEQGRQPRLPRVLFDQLTPGTGNVPEPSQDMSTRLQEVFHIVQQELQQASQTQVGSVNFIVPYKRLRHSNIFAVNLVKSNYTADEPLIRCLNILNKLSKQLLIDFSDNKSSFRTLLFNYF